MIRVLLFVVLPFFAAAQIKLEFVKKSSSFKHPENVCVVSAQKIFIADIGKTLKSAEHDSDGVVYECSLENVNAKNKFNKTFKLNAPKGMVVHDNVLFIADVNRIVLANIQTGLKTDEITFADTTVSLNDLFLLDDNTLLVSATNRHELFAVNLESKEIISLSNNSIEGANGLCRDTNKIYVCGFSSKLNKAGSLYEYDLDNNTTRAVAKDIGHLDGIKMYKNNLLYSDWGIDYNHGKIWELNPVTKTFHVIFEDESLKSPSGFDIIEDLILIPCLDNGTILVFKLLDKK